MIAPELEAARPATGEGFEDEVTVAFGDVRSGLFGMARVALRPAAGSAEASVLLLDGAEHHERDVPLAGQDWASLTVGAVRMGTERALGEWTAVCEADAAALELRLRALSPAAPLGDDGYASLCHVTGRVGTREVDCLGARIHSWGALDWTRVAALREAHAWVSADRAVFLRALRPAGASDHGGDLVVAGFVRGAGTEAVAALADEARLSVTSDPAGRARRLGIELWEGEEDDYPRRLAGERVGGTVAEDGGVRREWAFHVWRSEGRAGAGLYRVAQPA